VDEVTVTKLDADWHERHRLPARATLDERVRWHIAHAKACACRPIPPTIAAALKRRALAQARAKKGGR
jgi:hypothetical protein